ncbi:MAG: 50S ribosomal protein L25 [Acidobacteria bacterium]|nr:50S ribosomal protein L25 [Acidobacteriota bacterium]MXZ71357.1 50S ribosomal protein L25 [Acidobacteriota bacterium]MYD70545.1 50S ribosomal protein L25 [Acidobacteriota bacterium]MYJ06178.1 50S ribosomal protein L25 [Acidobacteriota bacterium]
MDLTLTAATRTTRGKNEARRLRRAGQVPGVVYGGTDGDTAVTIDPKQLLRLLHSESGLNTIFDLEVDGGRGSAVLVKDVQLSPLTDELLHVDFLRVALDKVITVNVPVHLTGEAAGVKQQGGLVDFTTREVQVECLPREIPEHIEVDVTPLHIGEGIRLRDVTEDVDWTPVTDLDVLLVHVVASKVDTGEEEGDEEEVEDEAAADAEGEKEEKAEGGGS